MSGEVSALVSICGEQVFVNQQTVEKALDDLDTFVGDIVEKIEKAAADAEEKIRAALEQSWALVTPPNLPPISLGRPARLVSWVKEKLGFDLSFGDVELGSPFDEIGEALMSLNVRLHGARFAHLPKVEGVTEKRKIYAELTIGLELDWDNPESPLSHEKFDAARDFPLRLDELILRVGNFPK